MSRGFLLSPVALSLVSSLFAFATFSPEIYDPKDNDTGCSGEH
jgi:hypothetical protein